MKLLPDKKHFSTVIVYLLAILTFLWPVFYLNKGIAVTDTAFVLSSYKYVFTDCGIRDAATGLSDILGGALYALMPGYQALLFQVLGWLAYVAVCLMVYSWLKNDMPRPVLWVCLFIGTLYVRVFPTVLNYNSFSVLFFCIGITLLLKGLKQNKPAFFIASGFTIGINVFFRLPNILQASLFIPIVWYYWFCKNDKKNAVRQTIFFGIGFLGGLFTGFAIIGIVYGVSAIADSFVATAALATDAQDGHNILSMVITLFGETWLGFKRLLLIAVVPALGYALAWLLQRFSKRTVPVWMRVLISAAFLWLYWRIGYRIHETWVYAAILCIVVAALWAVGIALIFKYRKDQPLFSTLILIACAVVCCIAIGSDNTVYQYVIFSHFILAMAVCVLMHGANWLCEKLNLKKNLPVGIKHGLLCILLFSCLQNSFYNTRYRLFNDVAVFDATATICAPDYEGMHTGPQRAKELDMLRSLLLPYEGNQLLVWGNFSIGNLITDMKPYLTYPWVDLKSFSYAQFSAEFTAKRKAGILPVILIREEFMDDFKVDKYNMILDLIAEERYKVVYQDDLYTLYIPPNL
ncbi:MAG: hypothetical protein PHG02_00950 [Oscillospiraceae bacterium]|nr:hypothetical protein [Oscillospiraceae bacterium]